MEKAPQSASSEKLFQPDNFSRTEIAFKPADPHLSLLGAMINSHFPEWRIVEAQQLDRNEINSGNYEVELESEAHEKKRVLVREYKTLQDAEHVRFYLEFLDVLRERGVRVSAIHKTTQDTLFAQSGEKIYAVFEFIDATHFVPTELGFASVAKEVAIMHQAFDALQDDNQDRIDSLSKHGHTFFNDTPQVLVSDLEKIEHAIEEKKEHTETDALIYAKLSQYKEIASQIEAMRNKIQTLPKQIFHSDLHPHNILMRKDIDEVAALVDFDSMRVQPLGQALDVAYAIYRLGKQFFVSKTENLEQIKKRAGKLRELFIAHYQTVKPLSREELELLPLLCKEEIMKKLVYLLKGAYLGNNIPWLHELPKFVSALDEIDCFWK
jgi:Ser/Thr protein kinase RdoA (MazF antagonist)